MTDLRLHYKEPRTLIKPASQNVSSLHGLPHILPATSHCCLQHFHRDCAFFNLISKVLFGDENGAV